MYNKLLHMKDTTVTLRLSEKLKSSLEQEALKLEMSLSSYIRFLLIQRGNKNV